MKNLLLILSILLCSLGAGAQELTTDYIYSSEGFEVKTAVYSDERNTYRSIGLYSKDGKTFVAAIAATRDYITTNTFIILDGCETIASGAFQSVYNYHIYIPSSVKSIAPDAFTSKVRIANPTGSTNLYNVFRGIINNAFEEDENTDQLNAPARESVQGTPSIYNLQGQKIPEPTPGINILKKPDAPAEKILL